jgi:hypothetical protein
MCRSLTRKLLKTAEYADMPACMKKAEIATNVKSVKQGG